MNTKKLLLSMVVCTTAFFSASATSPALLVSEDFSSAAWGAEVLRLQPTYVQPTTGNFGLDPALSYFDKYKFNGALVSTTATTFTCPLFATESITHGNGSNPIGFRLRNSGDSYMEFPTLSNAGNMILHVRNNSATAASGIKIQKYDENALTWIDVTTFTVSAFVDYSTNNFDEIFQCDIASSAPVKLRIYRGGTTFVSVYRVDIYEYSVETAVEKIQKKNNIEQVGRKLRVDKPSIISLYNTVGTLVFCGRVETDYAIPASMGNGLFLVKTGNSIQKVLLNN